MATRNNLRRCALGSVFCIALLTTSSAAFALAGGSRQPINPVGGEQLWSPSNIPVLSVNPERSVVVGTEGHQSVTSFTVDQTAGTIRGYAGYRLDADTSVARQQAPGLVGAMGNMVFIANVDGDVAEATSFITAELSVHGSMAVDFGQPWLALAGGLGVNRYVGGFATGTLHAYDISTALSNTTEAGWQPTVDARITPTFTGDEVIVAQDALSTWAQGSTVVSTDLANLSVVLRITVPVSEGDVLTFASLVGATATHAYTSIPEATPIGSPIAVTAASGHVDFGNTGVLRIYVPDGLSLSGANAPGSNIVLSTPVPEPSALGLALAGGMGLLWRGRHRRSA